MLTVELNDWHCEEKVAHWMVCLFQPQPSSNDQSEPQDSEPVQESSDAASLSQIRYAPDLWLEPHPEVHSTVARYGHLTLTYVKFGHMHTNSSHPAPGSS